MHKTESANSPGKLWLVPTPIGNLEDMTPRGVRILKEVQTILAEDTRTSGKIFKHFGIDTPARPFHAHNEHKSLEIWVERLQAGAQLALITDAGTPGISDPGFLLVRAALQAHIAVECLPGPVALIPALVESGFPCDRFVFEGFLPHKKGRQSRIKEWASEPRTIVFYESPHRIEKTLKELNTLLGPDKKVALCRELSKLHHEVIRGTVQEVLTEVIARPRKGEMILVLEGNK